MALTSQVLLHARIHERIQAFYLCLCLGLIGHTDYCTRVLGEDSFGYLIAMTVLVYYVWNAHHHLDDRIEESVSTLMTDCVRSYAKKTRRSDCPRGVCPSDHWPHVSSVGSIILVPRLPFFPSIGNAMRFSHNLLNHD